MAVVSKKKAAKTKTAKKRIFKKKRAEVKRDKHGNRLCVHNNRARECNTFPCHGAGICKHNIQKWRCKKCGGGALCGCGVQRSRCVKCGVGGSLCKCDPPKEKRHCKKCMPNTHYAKKATECIRDALKRDQKKCKYDKVLGKPVGEYRKWLEEKWTNKDWSWANYGKVWVVDHIEPLSLKANKDDVEPSKDAIVRRLHYSNTQPLGKTENMRKYAKVVIRDV